MRLTIIRRRRERYHTDSKYRRLRDDIAKNDYKKHRQRRLLHAEEYRRKLNEYASKRCKLCDKLMDFRTDGDYCKECLFSNTILRRKENDRN